MKKLLLLTAAITMLISCNTAKNGVYAPTDFQVFFGSSGGFTNEKIEYVLNDDGNIFKIERDSTFHYKKIAKKKVTNIQHLLNESDFGKVTQNTPGNMSYFISVNSPEYKNKVIWNDGSSNKQIANLFMKLMETVKK
jgi:hypothetical protein